jgi:hypothetical protein
MKKQAVTKALETLNGSPFATVNELAKLFRMSKHQLPALLDGIEYIPRGRARHYLIADVVERYDGLKRL